MPLGCRRNFQGRPSYYWTRYQFLALGRRHPHPWRFPARSRYWVRKVGLIGLNLATLNVRGLGDSSKCACLLADFVTSVWILLKCKRLTSFALTDPKHVRVSLRLANRPSLAGYWKFNSSLLEIRDFRDRLKSLIKRALVGAVIGNRGWISLKHRIRDFATKYGR